MKKAELIEEIKNIPTWLVTMKDGTTIKVSNDVIGMFTIKNKGAIHSAELIKKGG